MKNLIYYFYLFLSLSLWENSISAKYIFVSNENSDTIVVLDKISKEIIKTIYVENKLINFIIKE